MKEAYALNAQRTSTRGVFLVADLGAFADVAMLSGGFGAGIRSNCVFF